MSDAAALTPSASTGPEPPLDGTRQRLLRAVPFAQMAPEHARQFLQLGTEARFAAGEVLLEPAAGPVHSLLCILQGSVSGQRGIADFAGRFEYGEADLFPVGALLGSRPVTATYVANEATTCLVLPAAAVQQIAALSAPFADFLSLRVVQFLELARQAARASAASQNLAEQSLEARLGSLPRKQTLSCSAATPLAEALARMHEQRVGSVLVLDETGLAQGILTRHDILGRVTLPQRPLSTAMAAVMSAPVHTLTVEHTLQDAALCMARHGIRHVPVTEAGRLVNIVSERDLFALQRLSIQQLSSQIRGAQDRATLRHLAAQIREFARNLLGQGVQARQLTELISHLNDLLTERLLQLVAGRRGLDLRQACWLAFGSEGRGEQTVATDQDNGLVFVAEGPQTLDARRAAWLALGLEVNEALDDCGYPLCKGRIMASNPECCLTAAEWQRRFAHWIDHGAPVDLLKASIFFDLRALGGELQLAAPLRAMLSTAPARVPRFLKQMADNALRNRAPVNWRGALDTRELQGRAVLDLKLHGTSIFVDSARLFALAQGLPALGTRSRLLGVAAAMHVPAQESQAWVAGFEFLQLLRLQLQVGGAAVGGNPNLVEVATLNDIDRRMLLETMRVARRLQQRIELDYPR